MRQMFASSDNWLISVIIPALRRPDLTQRCLDSLGGQTLSIESFEIIIVENDARPESILADPLPKNARRIALVDNYGTTGSINRGISDSSSKYVLLLNNDVELHPDFLYVLVCAMEADQQCGFCTGKLVNAWDRTRLDGVGDAVLLGGGVYRLGHSDIDVGQFIAPFPVLAGCGAATLFRRSVLRDVGGLDEDFFAYIDDVDLALRVQLMGYSGMCIPQAIAWHLGSATLKHPFHPKIAEWMTRNQILLVLKNYPTAILVRLLPRIVTFQTLWLMLNIARGRFFSYVKGMLGALRLLPRMMRKRQLLMRTRRIGDQVLLRALRSSEEQVFNWYRGQPASCKSKLLTMYFGLFH